MSNGGGDQNQQQNQGKNKGGGGGGSGGPGISLASRFDSGSVGNVKDLKKQMAGQFANGLAMLAAIAVGGLSYMFLKDTLDIDDGPAQPQGGGGGGGSIQHPGQIVKALGQLKDHPAMSEFAPKIKEALGE